MKGSCKDLCILACEWPNHPPGACAGQRPPRPTAGALHPPGRALPFGRVAHPSRRGAFRPRTFSKDLCIRVYRPPLRPGRTGWPLMRHDADVFIMQRF